MHGSGRADRERHEKRKIAFAQTLSRPSTFFRSVRSLCKLSGSIDKAVNPI